MTTENQRSADDDEIIKFSQTADKWWDRNSELKSLYNINPPRLNYIDCLAPLAGKRILDVGCGGGILSESMVKRGAVHVTSIDTAEKSLQATQTHVAVQEVGDIAHHCVRVEDLVAEVLHNFDVIICMGMMEHVPDSAVIVKACVKLVKLDGTVFPSTISRNLKFHLHLVVGAEYMLNFVPKGMHNRHKFITSVELARMRHQAGLGVIDTREPKYNLLVHQLSLDSRTDVNYMAACRPVWSNLRNNKGRLKTLFPDGLDVLLAVIIRQRPILF